jgi:flagellar biosynthetic protein FliR
MPSEISIPVATLFAFLLVLCRVSGVFIFVPLPGIQTGAEVVRALLALSFTFALYSRWPVNLTHAPSLGELIGWVVSEAVLGLAIGLVVSIVTEAFQMGAQILSLQAGYSFASTIDPTTHADSTVLVVIAQLIAALLFFATGLDHKVFVIFSQSLETYPPGSFTVPMAFADKIIPLGASIFLTGFRLVLPIVALLLMVDISLASLGRLNSQLQMLTMAFPAKMLIALAFLAWLLVLFPQVFSHSADEITETIGQLIYR